MTERQANQRSKGKWFLGMFVATGLFLTLAGDVLAIIGRPATPVSVAGVARRSVRRGYYY